MKGMIITLLILASISVKADPNSPTIKESVYIAQLCKGKIEVRVEVGRVDCLTDTHAIEYDKARKFKEAIGQALWYAFQTNKKAGIVLIIEKPKDVTYYHRLESLIQHNNLAIDVWKVDRTQVRSSP